MATVTRRGLRVLAQEGDEPPLHLLVERQAARTPHAVAVEDAAGFLTYAELDARSAALARVLRGMGVGPEARVGVSLEAGTDLVVSLLSVLRAGGCFVPVAHDTPAPRWASLLASTRPAALLADGTARDGLAGVDPGCPVVDPGVARTALRTLDWPRVPPREWPWAWPADGEPEDPAYVIFTSGSTGTPRGVVVPHRGIANTLAWRQRRFPFRMGDRVLLTFSFVFDAALFELFQPLVAGARVVVPTRELAGDPGATVAALAQHRVTVLGVVPSTLRLLLGEPGLDAAARDLRLVFCGGEPLDEDLVREVNSRLPAELVNVYGPTEASMEASYWVARPGSPVSLGEALDGVQLHVLDPLLRPVADDVDGELFIGGRGVARGYLGDARQTATCFVPDPWSSRPGQRMYRTGDRARRSGGTLIYRGRRDDQVKLRGRRIELGEVETAVRSHPAVREAAVVVRGADGSQRLVAYVVARLGGDLTEEGLRRHLVGLLPTSLVPTATVLLPSLPRTATGKVALRELPEPPAAAAVPTRPRDAVEAGLAELWSSVLGRPVGRDDDFFALGGSSVQAAILAHALEDRLGEFVYPVAVYDAPTVARLADRLREDYPDALVRVWGRDAVPGAAGPAARLTEADLTRLRLAVRPRADAADEAEPAGDVPRLRPAVFVLSPPRSGSTLLRVTLAAHPRLFAPPELQLLNFPTLRVRRDALSSERDSFWLQGPVRALMELDHISAEHAEELMAAYEAADLSVRDFYAALQARLGDRLLVDKTPTYSLDPHTLSRAEQDFASPRYLHLVRDPQSVVASFERPGCTCSSRPSSVTTPHSLRSVSARRCGPTVTAPSPTSSTTCRPSAATSCASTTWCGHRRRPCARCARFWGSSTRLRWPIPTRSTRGR